MLNSFYLYLANKSDSDFDMQFNVKIQCNNIKQLILPVRSGGVKSPIFVSEVV